MNPEVKFLLFSISHFLANVLFIDVTWTGRVFFQPSTALFCTAHRTFLHFLHRTFYRDKLAAPYTLPLKRCKDLAPF